MEYKDFIWILQNGKLPYAVFNDLDKAKEWIRENKASGLMTGYPVNQSALFWATSSGFFKVKRKEHETIEFEEKFTSASMPHYHFEKGKIET